MQTPGGTITRVLLLTNSKDANYARQPTVSIIPLVDSPREKTGPLTVLLKGSVAGGAFGDVHNALYANVGAIFPTPKANLILGSAAPIRRVEVAVIKERVRAYLAL